jgi:hypothetical protein
MSIPTLAAVGPVAKLKNRALVVVEGAHEASPPP